ncbi:MAG TPA: hypothetical protein VJZ74_01065, partial [Pseudolabrys sp.]|nr:hypothetical protein [Pseudolabrys sp.]
MLRHRFEQAARTAAIAVSFIFLFAIVALAQDKSAQNLPAQNLPAQELRQNEPGRFDFYVLALSWSPS